MFLIYSICAIILYYIIRKANQVILSFSLPPTGNRKYGSNLHTLTFSKHKSDYKFII